MKKIYSFIVAVLVVLSFKAEALSLPSPKCIGWASQRCKTLEGLNKYEADGCIYKKDSAKLNSKCYRTFCSLNCRKILSRDQECPTDGELLDKCKKVCRTLDYGNDKIRDEVDACIGGVMTGDEASQKFYERKTAEEQLARAEKRRGKGAESMKRWLSAVKKICEERNKTYISALSKVGKSVTIEDFEDISSRLEGLSRELKNYLNEGKRHKAKFPAEVNQGYALARKSTERVQEYLDSIEQLGKTAKDLRELNDDLKAYPSGTSIDEVADPAEDPTPALVPTSRN